MVVIDQRSTFTGAYALQTHGHGGGPDSEGPPKRGFAIWLATHITASVGTIYFFVTVLGLTIAWLLWNGLGPKPWRFDPAPGYVLWLFISNLLQLTLLPLLMMSQNHQTRDSEERALQEYERIDEILACVRSLHAPTEQQTPRMTLEERMQAIEERQREAMQILRRLEAGERLRHQQAAHDASSPLPVR